MDMLRPIVATAALVIAFSIEHAAAAWIVQDKALQSDNTHAFIATLDSTNGITGANGHVDPATLIVRCAAGKLELYISWPTLMNDYRRQIQWKFDAGDIKNQNWHNSADGTSTFDPTPKDFLMHLKAAKELVVDAVPYHSDNVEAEFDVTGADRVADRALAACPSD